MIRITLSARYLAIRLATILTTSILLVSCNTGLPDEVAQQASTPSNDAPVNTTKPFLSNSINQDSSEDEEVSVAGLWDLSDQVDVVYQYWTDNDTYAIYDYQGDGDGSGENCYEFEDVAYTREGSAFTYEGETHKITRDANTLTIDGVPFPLIISQSIVDLNVCI